MRILRSLSIKHKLTLIIMLTSGVALLLACAALITYEVYVQSDLREFNSRLEGYLTIVAATWVVSLLVALLLSGRLRLVISEPIWHLAQTVKAVSAEKNYSLRAARRSDDELGLLIDGFNEMLEQIHRRDEQLWQHRQRLEEEVAALVAWLASTECSFSTGAVYDLSGGRATY